MDSNTRLPAFYNGGATTRARIADTEIGLRVLGENIHLYSTWFDLSPKQRATVMAHELSHWYIVTNDYGYFADYDHPSKGYVSIDDITGAKKKVTLTDKQLLDNADTFAGCIYRLYID